MLENDLLFEENKLNNIKVYNNGKVNDLEGINNLVNSFEKAKNEINSIIQNDKLSKENETFTEEDIEKKYNLEKEMISKEEQNEINEKFNSMFNWNYNEPNNMNDLSLEKNYQNLSKKIDEESNEHLANLKNIFNDLNINIEVINEEINMNDNSNNKINIITNEITEEINQFNDNNMGRLRNIKFQGESKEIDKIENQNIENKDDSKEIDKIEIENLNIENNLDLDDSTVIDDKFDTLNKKNIDEIHREMNSASLRQLMKKHDNSQMNGTYVIGKDRNYTKENDINKNNDKYEIKKDDGFYGNNETVCCECIIF